MKTGRDDLDHRLKISSVPVGEPTFFIRGHDVAGPGAVRAYAALSAASGAPPAAIEQALQQADRMEAWPSKRPVNADHLGEDERKDLEAQLGRRAWERAVDLVPTERDLLIKQLGYDEARGKVRHIRGLMDAALMALAQEEPDIARAKALLADARRQAMELG